MSMGKTIATVAAGALFGFGLALSTMIRPEVVLSFLQFRDWGLALVMGGGVVVTLLAYKLIPLMLRHPLFGGEFGKVAQGGQRALPRRTEELGYAFKSPEIDGALRNLVG